MSDTHDDDDPLADLEEQAARNLADAQAVYDAVRAARAATTRRPTARERANKAWRMARLIPPRTRPGPEARTRQAPGPGRPSPPRTPAPAYAPATP